MAINKFWFGVGVLGMVVEFVGFIEASITDDLAFGLWCAFFFCLSVVLVARKWREIQCAQ